MGDIVERLKSQNELYVQKYVGTYDIDENKIEPLCEEAAAEITRLREENARLLDANKDLKINFDVMYEDLKKAQEQYQSAKRAAESYKAWKFPEDLQILTEKYECAIQENARLRDQVKYAYFEGWWDSAKVGSKEIECVSDWETSNARANLGGL